MKALVEKIGNQDSAVILSKRALTFKDEVTSIQTNQSYNLFQAIDQKKSSAISCARIPNSDQILILAKENEENTQAEDYINIRDDSRNSESLYIMNEPSSRSDNPLGYGTTGLPSVQRLINIGPGVSIAKTKSNWFMLKDRKIEHIDQQFQENEDKEDEEDNQEDENSKKESIKKILDADGDLLPDGVTLSKILDLKEWTDIKSRETIHGITKVCLHYMKRIKIDFKKMYEQIKLEKEENSDDEERKEKEEEPNSLVPKK